MSGRAGRRGKDLRGHVVVLVDRGFDEAVARGLMMVRGGGGSGGAGWGGRGDTIRCLGTVKQLPSSHPPTTNHTPNATATHPNATPHPPTTT